MLRNLIQLLIYFLAFTALVAWSVSAQTATTTRGEVWLGYIDWIVANSNLEYNGEPLPEIEYVQPGMLEILAFGAEAVAQAEYDGRDLANVSAVYGERTIYLTEDVEPDPWVILHELVHFLQDVNGTTDECVGANEPEAYLLHHKWQGEHGYEQNPGNILWGMMLGQACVERRYGMQ